MLSRSSVNLNCEYPKGQILKHRWQEAEGKGYIKVILGRLLIWKIIGTIWTEDIIYLGGIAGTSKPSSQERCEDEYWLYIENVADHRGCIAPPAPSLTGITEILSATEFRRSLM